jgi:parallel beta-helix repeat protein
VLGSQWRAVELRNVSRVTITGNTIYDSADLSVFAARSAGIVVSGNAFVWRGNDSEPPKDGLRFEDCDNVLLSGLATQRFCAGSAERGAAVTFVRCSDCGVSDARSSTRCIADSNWRLPAAESPTTRLSIAASRR